jgi:hypothetical protein
MPECKSPVYVRIVYRAKDMLRPFPCTCNITVRVSAIGQTKRHILTSSRFSDERYLLYIYTPDQLLPNVTNLRLGFDHITLALLYQSFCRVGYHESDRLTVVT